MPMNVGLHHVHKRERNTKKELENYPSRKKWVRLMDKLIFIVGISGPIITIPQIMKIWVEQNASGLHLLTWSVYLVIGFFWITYGLMHKSKPIILTYVGWVIVHALIVIGILMYG
jgi:uncharacterized protein with PQ loop repeat